MSKRTRLLSKLKHVYSHNAKLVLDVENDDIGLIIDAVETKGELNKRKLTPELLERYMKFEDECIRKGYTFESLLKARDKQETGVTSHSERDIVECCIKLMGDMYTEFIDYLDYMDVKFDKEDMPSFSFSYFYIVQQLLLWRTHHSGGTSTRHKCNELGLDWGETIKFRIDEEGVVND